MSAAVLREEEVAATAWGHAEAGGVFLCFSETILKHVEIWPQTDDFIFDPTGNMEPLEFTE